MSVTVQLPNQEPRCINGRLGAIVAEFITQLLQLAQEDAGLENLERDLKITANCRGRKVKLSIEKYL